MKLGLRRAGSLPSATVEAELSAWLRGFEPAGVPISLRLRASADLRAQVSYQRPWLGRTRHAFAAAGSLGANLLGVGLVLLVVAVAASLSGPPSGSGATSQPPVAGQPGSWSPIGLFAGQDPMRMGLLLIVSLLVAIGVCVRQVRAAMIRTILADHGITPAALLPLRRPIRGIPRLTWAIVALGLVNAAWVGLIGLNGGSGSAVQLSQELPVVGSCVLVSAIALRYSWRDRSGRLLLLGSLAFLLSQNVAMLLYATVWLGEGIFAFFYLPYLAFAALSALSTLALAAGLVIRTRATRPPLAIVAVVCAGTFFFTGAQVTLMYGSPITPNSMAALSVRALEWLDTVGWFAILRVGLVAVAHPRPAATWKLVSAAGVLALVSRLVSDVGFVLVTTPTPTPALGQPTDNIVEIRAVLLAGSVAVALLLVALAVGLGPVGGGGEEDALPADGTAEQAAPTPSV